MKTRIWNVDFSTETLESAIELAVASLSTRRTAAFAFVNPHSQVIASRDEEFETALRSMEYVFPDGIGVIIASRILRAGLRSRVTGERFFLGFTSFLNDQLPGTRYFFLGSSQEVLRRIRLNLTERYPKVSLVGTYSPPMGAFTEDDVLEMVLAINQVNPDVLWVGLTAPKQEKLIAKVRAQLDVPVLAGIGAQFDYFAGTKKRPPEWVRDCGLQWLHRFVQEPKRTWNRHFLSMPRFLWEVGRCWIRKQET